MAGEFTLDTIVSGRTKVIIEGIGDFLIEEEFSSLRNRAGGVYAVLTRKMLFDDGDFFELVSFSPEKQELIVRVAKQTAVF